MNIKIEKIAVMVRPVLKDAGVIRSAIFGSYARGEEKRESDIDILVEFPRGKSLFDLVDLEQKLEKVLGKKVDLHTFGSVNRRLKYYIEQDQIQIF